MSLKGSRWHSVSTTSPSKCRPEKYLPHMILTVLPLLSRRHRLIHSYNHTHLLLNTSRCHLSLSRMNNHRMTAKGCECHVPMHQGKGSLVLFAARITRRHSCNCH